MRFSCERAARMGVAILGAAILWSGSSLCAQSVHTDYDRHAPFNDYHTFSFAKVQTTNPLDVQRVKNEIRRDLTYYGWKEVPSGGDVTVTAVEAEHNSKEYDSFYDGLGPGFGWGGWGGMGGDSTTSVREVPVGTLMVDLYDRHTHNMVWRGISHENVSDNLRDDTGKLQKAIDEMFYKFPPKTK